jgi:uncharacterized membrane protein HdeD (DUF308 family)
MNIGRLVGIGIIALGAVLLIAGYHASEAPLEQFSNTITGHFSDRTTWQMLAGVVAIVVGIVLATFGASRR